MNAVVEQKAGVNALAMAQQSGRLAVPEIIGHVSMVQEVMRAVMKPDVHYGKIPGTPKPTLYKPGAEVLCLAFRIAPSYQIEDLSTPDMIRYRVTCTGTHQTTGIVLGDGLGEASSSEEKYKWRKSICIEEFEETPAHMRRKKYGRQSGGGHYVQEQVRTEPADLANTVLKMASKRAHMAMVLNVTAASDCFSQDLEDMDEALRDHLHRRGEEGSVDGAQTSAGQGALPPYPDEKITANLPEWKKAIKDGKAKSVDQIVAFIKSKNTLMAEQEKRIREGCTQPAPGTPAGDAPTVTAADVLAKMEAAKTSEELDEAASLIPAVPEAERAALNARYDELHAKFNPQE